MFLSTLILKNFTGFLHCRLSQSMFTTMSSPGLTWSFSSVMMLTLSEAPTPITPPTSKRRIFWIYSLGWRCYLFVMRKSLSWRIWVIRIVLKGGGLLRIINSLLPSIWATSMYLICIIMAYSFSNPPRLAGSQSGRSISKGNAYWPISILWPVVHFAMVNFIEIICARPQYFDLVPKSTSS